MKRLIQIVEWLGLAWAFFILFEYLKIFPLNSTLIFSILPTQIRLPTIPILFFYIKGIVLFLGVILGSYSYGTLITNRLNVQWISPLEKDIFSIALGHGVTSLFILFLASLHWLHTPLLYSLWGFGFFLFILILINRGINRGQSLKGQSPISENSLKECFKFIFGSENLLWVRIFIWIFLTLSFMMALVPELFYDSLVYHLGVPNLYLQEHGIVHIPGVLSKVPMIWQTLYLFGLALQDEMIPKLIHWSNGVLILLALGTLAKRFQFPKAGLISGLIFISTPMVQMNLWTSGIDIGGALFALLAVYALCVRVEHDSKEHCLGWVILSSIFAAFSFGSKYQGGITALILFLILFLTLLLSNPRNIKAIFYESSIFILVFSLLISPWLLKNFWDTGNPLFPFLSSLFKKLNLQKVELDPDQWIGFINENRRFITSSFKEFWTLPWKLTFKDSNQSSLSFTGPIFLAVLPFILVLTQHWKKKSLQFLFLFIILFFAFSLNSTHLTRYHLQGYPALSLLLGIPLCLLLDRPFFKIALTLPLIFLLLENLQVSCYIIQNSYQPWDVLVGKESRQDYRSYSHPGLNPHPANIMFRWMEKNLPRSSRTLFLGDSKPFDLKLPYLYTDVHGQNPIIAWSKESQSTEDLKDKLKRSGITHFLVNFEEARRTYSYKMLKWDSDSLKKFDDFWVNTVKETHRELIPERYSPQGGILLLYEIDTKSQEQKGISQPNPMVILERIK